MAEAAYAKWAETYAMSVAAAQPKIAARRLTDAQIANVRAHRREHHPCGVKGCRFVTYKGELCRKHWRMVPERDRAEAAVAAIVAAHETARKYHRRFLRQVRAMEAT